MLEAVTVCVNYADYLTETLPHLKRYVDNVVVVTHPDDIATIEIATRNCVDVHCTTAFYADGAVFNKGAAINEGLLNLANIDWVLHIDADILLLDEIPVSELNKQYLYGATRLKTPLNKWRLIKAGGAPTLHSIPTRYQHGQYAPAGFFQLWNADRYSFKYPEQCSTAGKSDIDFSQKWQARDRKIIPDYVMLHLETDDNQYGINWKGRQTKLFKA